MNYIVTHISAYIFSAGFLGLFFGWLASKFYYLKKMEQAETGFILEMNHQEQKYKKEILELEDEIERRKKDLRELFRSSEYKQSSEEAKLERFNSKIESLERKLTEIFNENSEKDKKIAMLKESLNSDNPYTNKEGLLLEIEFYKDELSKMHDRLKSCEDKWRDRIEKLLKG